LVVLGGCCIGLDCNAVSFPATATALSGHLNNMRKRWFIIVGLIVASAVAASYGIRFGKRVLQRRALSIECANYMVAIDLAARMWANDHDERLPPDLLRSHLINTYNIKSLYLYR
jgi:hypothetical protein